MPTSNSNRSTLVLCVLLGMMQLGLVHCGSQKSQAQAGGRPPVAVTTTHVMRQTLEAAEALDGQVVPYLQSNVATETSGTVVKVYANEGDHVHAGEVLAKIDDAPLRAQLTEQIGSQNQAIAKLDQAQTQQPMTNQTAKSALSQAEQSVTQAQKQLLSDQAAIKQNELTYRADAKLYAQGYVASVILETAHAAYITSQQTLGIDETRVTQARSALDAARRNMLNITLQKQVVAENRGAVLQANGNTQLLQTQLGETLLIAPFDGVITQRMLDPGSYAGPNQPLFAVTEINPVYISFNVKDSDLAYIHPGTLVTFTTTSLPGQTLHGNVSTINVVPTSGTLLYSARMVVANPSEELKGGMLVRVRIVKSRARQVLVAPIAAVTQGLHDAAVYEVLGAGAQAVAHKIPVTLGIQTPEYIQISSSHLHEGMSIILNKPDLLQDGAPIALVSDAQQATH